MEHQAALEDQDEELVRKVKCAPQGDLRAFELLVERHKGRITADCRHITRDPNNAEDLAQEVFVKAFFGLPGFEGRSSFRHWLQRIKLHHCLNHLKKRGAAKGLEIDQGAGSFEQFNASPTSVPEFTDGGERGRIAAILDSLPSTLRIPLVMREMDDLTYEEIAKALGIGLSAVKMRIKRAREEFRRRYAPPSATPPNR
jgi:RNA polymerase sigma-70 factor (ECF subfamily)